MKKPPPDYRIPEDRKVHGGLFPIAPADPGSWPDPKADLKDDLEAMTKKIKAASSKGYIEDEVRRALSTHQAQVVNDVRRARPQRDYKAEADAWVASHPKAYELFIRFVTERAARGHRVGMKAVAERVRWEFPEASGKDEYYVNNSLVAYIGRRIVEEWPRLGDFIEFREARDDRKIKPEGR